MIDLVAAGLDQLHERVAGRFGRAEPRARVREYVSGLVAGLERKNGWTLAEWAGEVSPDGMQRLLRRADWDVDGVRDDVRAYVVEQLGEPDGVLIADDTGFLKKGTRSAGVQRQYSGTAGRTENCQVGVFLAYASAHGHALIDRELYVPRSWTDDPERCRAAGIPPEAEFATKPRQAQVMIARAITAGVPFAWFTADEAYGQAKWLQAWLEDQDVSSSDAADDKSKNALEYPSAATGDSGSDNQRHAGIFDNGFEAYRTVTDDDYRSLFASGLIVLDTNVLLDLYRYHPETRQELLDVLDQLRERLWIPNQVMAEFWAGRESVIEEASDIIGYSRRS